MVADTNQLPRGLICPLVTPLKTGDAVDVSVLDRLIDHVGVGVDVLLLCDVFWGEGHELSPETRLEMCCAALEIIQGRWPVFITITSHSVKATRDLLAHTEAFIERSDYPGSVFWVDYPIYYHSNRGLPQLYESMARDTRIGLILGNHEGLVELRKRRIKHKNIRTNVLKRLSQIEKIQGLVFSGPLKRSINYQKAVRHRRGFRFFDGDELAFLRQPSSDGVVAGGANLLPEAWRGITWSCLNRYDIQQQYADHTSQILETGMMLQEFYELYSQNPAAILKRMLHVAGVLPNDRTASATRASTASQNREIEVICKKYDLV
ncbi:MAG: dihydrodipicolinate synthase family protein [Proteobacteria bacterium]|nr:dihydrodipicolinate synthase family protein [Pseudomonadota bacterium]